MNGPFLARTKPHTEMPLPRHLQGPMPCWHCENHNDGSQPSQISTHLAVTPEGHYRRLCDEHAELFANTHALRWDSSRDPAPTPKQRRRRQRQTANVQPIRSTAASSSKGAK